ncbi:MAG: hypothetical protein MJ152_04545, partial [Clostridia bacterium]|nr:hypothetical protein [Clostridia bacterium]
MKFFDKCVSAVKNNFKWILVAAISVFGLSFLFQFINELASGYSTFFDVVSLFVVNGVFVALLVCCLLAVLQGNKRMLDICATIFFVLFFYSKLSVVFAYFDFLTYDDAFVVSYGLFMIFTIATILTMAVLFSIDFLKRTSKFGKVIDILLGVLVVEEVIMFVLSIIGSVALVMGVETAKTPTTLLTAGP